MVTNATGKTDYSGLEIVGSTAFSFGSSLFVSKYFGIKTKTGLTKGVNSYLAIWKGGLTKLRNGTVGRMSLNVAIKGLESIFSLRFKSALIGGTLSGILEWINWLIGKDNKIGYV